MKKNLASRLNKRIEIQALTETPDGGGGYTSTWNTTTTVWAEIKPLRGREIFESLQVQKEASFTFTIRYKLGVTTKMRIKYGSRVFNIRAVINPDEHGELLELLAEEFVAV